MNCELAHERIVSAAYGELPDEFGEILRRPAFGRPARAGLEGNPAPVARLEFTL